MSYFSSSTHFVAFATVSLLGFSALSVCAADKRKKAKPAVSTASVAAVTSAAALDKTGPTSPNRGIVVLPTPGDEVETELAIAAAAADRQSTKGDFFEDPLRLYDREGRLIEARLISATGDVITVERTSDQREFQINMENFHDASQHYINLWLERDVEAIDYSLSIMARKRLIDSSDYEIPYKVLTTTKWAYDVELTNRTRNDLKGAEIEYRIFYEDEIYFLRTTPYPGKGMQRDGESVKLPEMGFNAFGKFTTPPVELDTYRYDPTRGEKEYRKDKLIGIWIRVVKNGETIAEYKSNPTIMGDFAWDDEDELEIIITDKFAEEFEGSQRIESE